MIKEKSLMNGKSTFSQKYWYKIWLSERKFITTYYKINSRTIKYLHVKLPYIKFNKGF